MSWEVLPVEVPGADTENMSLESLPTEVPGVNPENMSLEPLPTEVPGVEPENISLELLPVEEPGLCPENMSKGLLPMEEPGVYPENMSKGFLTMEETGLCPENMSKGFLTMEETGLCPENMSKGFLTMEETGLCPENMSKGFLTMEETGLCRENMSKGFLTMEEPEVYAANMSQELQPMELPETLYYMNKGKTMIPSNALEDGNSGLGSLGDGEWQKRKDDGTGPDQGGFKIESSPCYLLTVRIIRMRNLQRVDALSQADCYVSLWLPTATCERSRTKTVRNSDNPVWNETFYFRIQSQVKNVLELTVYDEDFATPDDHLLCALFDTAKLPLERTVILYFKPSPDAKEELEVEFKLEVAPGPHEMIATNGVLVCRELCCLEVEVAEKTKQKSKKELSLTVKGSFEGTQDIVLGPNGVVSPACPTEFHYIKYTEPTLDVMLPKKRRYHPWSCRYSTETGSPVVMLNSLPMGRKTTIAEEKRFDLNVTAKACNCLCHQDLDMRFGFNLCSEEMAFLGKRKRYVASALKNVFHLPHDLQDQEVPVVAIITTGGGLKSMTGLYGSLMGLKKLNLLDCITYISGLSGTTWTMANLYRDAYWSQKDLDSHIGEAQKQATKCKMGCFSMDRMKYYNKQLCQRKEEGYRTSFIDLWGLMIEYLLNDGKDPHKLSDQQEALCDGQNPLPIYVSVCVRDSYSTNDFKEWVEFTPYEVGLLKYGAFVRTEHFGSEFFMGRMLKKLPESRICYLQGMWSSIFSVNLLQIWGLSHSSEDFWKRWTQDRIDEVDEDPVLPTRPHELRTRMYTPPGPLSSALRGALTDRFSVAQHHNFLKGYQLHNSYMENQHFCRWKDTVLDTRPNQLMQNPDQLGMIDAGFFINTSSAPLLRPQREVDVIIYLSYTTGSHTSSLDKACKYYSEQKIPFPTISLTDEDKKNLKECYVFQDSDLPGCPIVIFLPLVNDTFKEYKAPGVKRCCSEMEEGQLDLTSSCSPYCMFSVRYTDDNYRKLLNLSEYNILNNSQMIMQALQTAMQRRRQKMC
ncbi:cytosolic phospholipase A2 epsilon-like [Passer montanus]|uniref:cytosolic phospholipase A2 epsilon-like n=1 Tax=Passer montanus TaxID=9160 RepID=UPI0019605696|nr:cytosolic phospholipase A2 epsilon-like [Passer montanus]